jgi:hypothetical protein
LNPNIVSQLNPGGGSGTGSIWTSLSPASQIKGNASLGSVINGNLGGTKPGGTNLGTTGGTTPGGSGGSSGTTPGGTGGTKPGGTNPGTGGTTPGGTTPGGTGTTTTPGGTGTTTTTTTNNGGGFGGFGLPFPLGGFGGLGGGGYAGGGYVDGGTVADATPVASTPATVAQAAPAATSDAAPAVAQAVLGTGSVDLVVEDIQMVQSPTLIAGPAYRVDFRNQGTQAAGSFRVGVYAALDGKVAEGAAAVVDVPGLAAGETRQVTLRLPVAAMKIVSVSTAQPSVFSQLLVAVDPDNAVSESNKTNNVAAVDRTALEAR